MDRYSDSQGQIQEWADRDVDRYRDRHETINIVMGKYREVDRYNDRQE